MRRHFVSGFPRALLSLSQEKSSGVETEVNPKAEHLHVQLSLFLRSPLFAALDLFIISPLDSAGYQKIHILIDKLTVIKVYILHLSTKN